MTGKPATVVAAQDFDNGHIICRDCLLRRADRMSDRWDHLSPVALNRRLRDLAEDPTVEPYTPPCSECGRELK